MKIYVVGSDGKVSAVRGTITQKQLGDGCTMVLAANPPGNSDGWSVGDVIPDGSRIAPEAITGLISLPKMHLLNCVAYGRRNEPTGKSPAGKK